VDRRRSLALLRTWLPLLVLSVAVAGAGAYGLSTVTPKTYEAQATVIVGQSYAAGTADYNQLLASQRLSATYASLATKRPLLATVIQELKLNESPDTLGRKVQAKAQADVATLTISAQDADPDRAAAIANAVADELITASLAVQGGQSDIQSSVDADLKSTQELIATTQARVKRLSQVTRTAAQDQELDQAYAQLITLRSTYAQLLGFASPTQANRLTVIEPAVPPTVAVSPRPLVNAILAATVAFLAVAAVAFVVESMNETVRNADDVEAVAGIPTLGRIQQMRLRGRQSLYRLAAVLQPRSPEAEAYRTLRTNVEFAAVDGPIRSLLVTSAVPGEGKTVTAANLAVVFAQAGRRVLLVDADLRTPGIDEIFTLENTQGLTTAIRDEMPLDTFAATTEVEGLRVVTTGPLPPNPAEILASQRMRTIVTEAAKDYDLVILDSPPLDVVTDAAVLSSYLGGTLLVVDARRTRRTAVRRAREALEAADARVLGAVLNRIPDRSPADYRDYYAAAYESQDGSRESDAGVNNREATL
jgi:succinoglycan biosynthesis transport protein ExoP